MGEDKAGYGSDESVRATVRRSNEASCGGVTGKCSDGLTRKRKEKKTAAKAENLREGSPPEFLGW